VIKVLLADDHPLVREALGGVIAETPDIRVVAECADGTEVVEAALRTEPDVVLMDLVMPRMTGLEATRHLLATRPDARVLMLTATVTVATACEARELGIAGYLVKGERPGDLPQHIRAVAAGRSAWCTAALAFLPDCD
jgi:DNA-binding NarL/FixJ family response regulator